MELRKLEPGEEWTGVHNISAVAEDGRLLARYACPCQWCEICQAAEPIMEAAMLDMDNRLRIRGEVSDRG